MLHKTISSFMLCNQKTSCLKMLGMVYEMEKLVDLKPVNFFKKNF